MHEQKLNICGECGYNTSTGNNMIKHKQGKHEGGVLCVICVNTGVPLKLAWTDPGSQNMVIFDMYAINVNLKLWDNKIFFNMYEPNMRVCLIFVISANIKSQLSKVLTGTYNRSTKEFGSTVLYAVLEQFGNMNLTNI